MRESKVLGIAVLSSMMIAGSFNWGEAAVSTVDSQELFHARLLQDNKEEHTKQQAAKAVDEAVRNLPELNSRLRWSAVKTSDELVEEQKAAERQTKAIPIIITAADVDRARKAEKRGEKTEIPEILSPRSLQPSVITPAPKPEMAPPQQPQQMQPMQPQPQTEIDLEIQPLPADVVELPAVQPVDGVMPGKETVELEIEKLPQQVVEEAIVEATSLELTIQEIGSQDTVELPAIEPVK